MIARYSRPLAATTALVFSLTACGGGGGGSAAGGGSLPTVPHAAASQRLGFTIKSSGGVLPFFATLKKTSSQPFAIAGTPITVTYNGVVVASGSLDGNGFAELTFAQAVPAGATVTVTIGSGSSAVTATITLATAIPATSADVTYNAGPPATLVVHSAADQNNDGKVDSSDAEQQTDTENPSNGEPEDANVGTGGTLPATLPITVSTCGTSTITIAPAAGAPSGLGLQFEEKVQDSDSSPQFEYQTASFTGPLTFPYLSSAARIDMKVTQNGQTLVSIEAPIGIVSALGAPSPTPAPSATPSAAPSVTPSTAPSAAPSASPQACPTISP